jgi:hypothetical protein
MVSETILDERTRGHLSRYMLLDHRPRQQQGRSKDGCTPRDETTWMPRPASVLAPLPQNPGTALGFDECGGESSSGSQALPGRLV